MQKLVDLRHHHEFVPQYVALRNRHAGLLLTAPVTVDETTEWLRHERVEVRCLIADNIVMGAVVLYLDRDGEIAIFVREQGRGTGSSLLQAIEETAMNAGLASVWAWVLADNNAAQRLFTKNGYRLEERSERRCNNETRQGLVFRKRFIAT